MNISEIIKWGDIELAGGFKGLYKKGWQKVGVTSKWSARELLAHLVSYEWLLVDALKHVLKQGPTPTLDAMNEDYDKFNDNQVEVRKGKSAQALMSEYKKAYREVLKLTKKLGTAKLEKRGSIPWYGKQYALDDFIVYANYAHKREHATGLKQFRKRTKI